jgi:quercetin dioxygenase-like cupin family protein
MTRIPGEPPQAIDSSSTHHLRSSTPTYPVIEFSHPSNPAISRPSLSPRFVFKPLSLAVAFVRGARLSASELRECTRGSSSKSGPRSLVLAASSASINTLQRIRAALGVNLWEFLDARPLTAPLEAKADRTKILVGATRLVKELLSPRNDRNLRSMIIPLPPGGESEDVIIGQGEKGGLVTQGQVRLTVGSEDFELAEGDSFQFPSSIVHKLSNPYDRPAQVIWVMSVLDSHI